MNNPTSTPRNSEPNQNSSAPKTEQKNAPQQTNSAPATGGGDRKDEKTNEAGRENKDQNRDQKRA